MRLRRMRIQPDGRQWFSERVVDTFGQPDEEIATRELAGKDPKTTVVVGGETAALGETGHSVFRQASFQCGQYGTFYFPFVSV